MTTELAERLREQRAIYSDIQGWLPLDLDEADAIIEALGAPTRSPPPDFAEQKPTLAELEFIQTAITGGIVEKLDWKGLIQHLRDYVAAHAAGSARQLDQHSTALVNTSFYLHDLMEAAEPFVRHYDASWRAADDDPCSTFSQVTFGQVRHLHGLLSKPSASAHIRARVTDSERVDYERQILALECEINRLAALSPSPAPGVETVELVKRLRHQAKAASDASKMLAEAKTRRQTDGGLYEGMEPEQTLEWQAADALSALSTEGVKEREAIVNPCKNCGEPRAEHRVPLGGADFLWCPGKKIDIFEPADAIERGEHAGGGNG